MQGRFAVDHLELLIGELLALREQMQAHEARHSAEVGRSAEAWRASARNLLHYLALRQHELRALQNQLTELGLSSLGRSESHALASVDAVLGALARMAATKLPLGVGGPPPVDFASGPRRLREHAAALLGEAPEPRDVRIMVTMPAQAAQDPELVRELVSAGMDVMRINAAHDGPVQWGAMIRHLKRACAEEGRCVRTEFDLGGPKLRTGELEALARLARWRVPRDPRGLPLAPARLWLAPADAVPQQAPAGAGAVLALEAGFLARSQSGDVLQLRDTRGRLREIRITAALGAGRWGECERGGIAESGAPVELLRAGRSLARGAIGELPPLVEPLLLRPGDLLRLCDPARSGRAARREAPEGELEPAQIPCTLPEVFCDLHVGERVIFDDGKIESVIRCVESDAVLVEITRAPAEGAKLRPDKGINLPDSRLRLPALTAADLEHLDFAVAHADLIGQSFVRSPDDVRALRSELARRGAAERGVLLKIETRAGFDALPSILLEALASPPVGVMVARGDLAVELGYERLAEVQEEILWLCEAAHVPVVWATQVLETLAKKGRASRAEVTDAAMSGRAECVMLNKGPHSAQAVRFLDDVLRRMKLHQEKKRSMLRRLSISSLSGRFLSSGPEPCDAP